MIEVATSLMLYFSFVTRVQESRLAVLTSSELANSERVRALKYLAEGYTLNG